MPLPSMAAFSAAPRTAVLWLYVPQSHDFSLCCFMVRMATSCLLGTGDLSKPNLGLGLELYKELASSLDTVVHNGALVNHAFTYEQLFEPNVLGSLEVRTALRMLTVAAATITTT